MKLDFRTKFFMTMVISTVCISGNLQVKFPVLSLFVSAIPFLLVLSQRKYKMFLQGLICVLVAETLVYFVLDQYDGFLGIMSVAVAGIVLRMMPGLVMGYYALVSTSMSDLVESLRRMKLPDALIIPISVMFRFLYSIKEDYALINDAMKMHGLTFGNTWKQPVRLLEYKMVPLLMCSSKVADDVSISAMTRGMTVGKKRSSISQTKLCFWDYVMMFLSAVLLYIFFSNLSFRG